MQVEGFTLLLTHSYTDSTEEDPEAPGSRRDVPLTPGHVTTLNAIWERETWSIGLEAYYTGRQPLDANPYRAEGRAYVLVGGLLQKRFGRVRVFLNLENVGNVRQTRFEPAAPPGARRHWPMDGRRLGPPRRIRGQRRPARHVLIHRRPLGEAPIGRPRRRGGSPARPVRGP